MCVDCIKLIFVIFTCVPPLSPSSLHQLRCAVQAVCVVVELSYLLDPLTGPRVTSLSQLLVRCIHATTSSINLLSQLAAIKAKLPPPTDTGSYIQQ